MYGKLIDGQIQFAPRHYVEDGYQISNPTPEMLIALGYLPVRYTDPPDVQPGYVAVPGWTELDGTIVQTWTVEEEPDEISEERAYRILAGEEE